MNKQIVDLLTENKMSISTAESFTGGSIAKSLVSISGASNVFYEGFVCYNSKAKIERLGVEKKLIEKEGVVSFQVAKAMVNGLLLNSKCDIAVATTGYADKNSDGKQVGLTYIAVGDKKDIIVEKNIFCGDRQSVMEQATNRALNIILNFLKGEKNG